MTKDGKGFSRNRIDSDRSETPFSYYCDNLIHGDLVYRVRDDFLNKDATIELLRIYIYKSRKSLEFIDCKILPVLKNFIEKSI